MSKNKGKGCDQQTDCDILDKEYENYRKEFNKKEQETKDQSVLVKCLDNEFDKFKNDLEEKI